MGDNFWGVDGVNADIVSVRRVIEGFDGVEHVISGFRYACDLGVGAGDYTFSAEIVDTNAKVIDELFFNKKMKTFEERCDEAYANKDVNALVGIMFTNRLLAFNGLASNIKTLNREFNYAATLWKKLRKAMFPIVGKRRKTTYKTIRRDCAKRNRGK